MQHRNLKLLPEGDNPKGIALIYEDFVAKKKPHSDIVGFKGAALRGWVLVLYVGICSDHIFQRFCSYYANYLRCSVND